MVDSGTRYARAISPVVRPPTRRKVSATRAGGRRTGWQAVNTMRSRSSSIAKSGSTLAGSGCSASSITSSLPKTESLRRKVASRRCRSIARCFAVSISHAPGFGGTPSRGHCSQRREQRVLREVLGRVDVSEHPRQPGNQPRPFDPPRRLSRPATALAWRQLVTDQLWAFRPGHPTGGSPCRSSTLGREARGSVRPTPRLRLSTLPEGGSNRR